MCEEKFPLCRFLPLTSPLSPAPLLLLPNPGLRGGKGGFGSLLRAIGAQVEHLQSGKMKRIHGLSFLDRGNNQPRSHEGPHWQEATGRQQWKKAQRVSSWRYLSNPIQHILFSKSRIDSLHPLLPSDTWMVRQIVRGWSKKRRRRNWRNWEK